MKLFGILVVASVSLFSVGAAAEGEDSHQQIGVVISKIDVDDIAKKVKEGQKQWASKADKIAKLVAERAKVHEADFKEWSQKAQPIFEETGRHIASISAQAPALVKQIEAEISSAKGTGVAD